VHRVLFALEVAAATAFTALCALAAWHAYRFESTPVDPNVVVATLHEDVSPLAGLFGDLLGFMVAVLATWALLLRDRLRRLRAVGLVWAVALAAVAVAAWEPVALWAWLTVVGLVHIWAAVRLFRISRTG
jgi:hypothetical protein